MRYRDSDLAQKRLCAPSLKGDGGRKRLCALQPEGERACRAILPALLPLCVLATIMSRASIVARHHSGFVEDPMAKNKKSDRKKSDSVYRVVDVVGISSTSWEDAGRRAVETAAGSLRDLRVAEVTKMDMRVQDGKVLAFRTRVALSFKYET